MFGRSRDVWQELRRSLRIKEQLPVQWKVKDSHLRGKGRVLNLSATGALLEAETSVSPMERCVFALESLLKVEQNYLPCEGRMVWSRHVGWGKKKVRCGIEFIKPSEDVVVRLQGRIQSAIARIAGAQRFRSIFGTALVVVMTAMTAFVIVQYRDNYRNILASNDIITRSYDQQTQLTRAYAKDILETKVLLEETRQLLSDAQVANAVLTDQLAAKDSQYAASAEKLAQLQQRNTELSVELAALSERLNFLEGNVNNIAQGREAIQEYHKKIRDVKGRIAGFKREAVYAKEAAQKERDRLESLAGNNGFIIKGGEVQPRDYTLENAAGRSKIDVEFRK